MGGGAPPARAARRGRGRGARHLHATCNRVDVLPLPPPAGEDWMRTEIQRRTTQGRGTPLGGTRSPPHEANTAALRLYPPGIKTRLRRGHREAVRRSQRAGPVLLWVCHAERRRCTSEHASGGDRGIGGGCFGFNDVASSDRGLPCVNVVVLSSKGSL